MALEFILHHYPESPFAEKIRSILGYKGVSYQSVIIPIIMPKPDVVALTGGYRKTPLLQIGADIYCDTALIAKVIDHHYPELPIYPQNQKIGALTMAQWSDQNLFRIAVMVAFQPRGIATNKILQDEEKRQKFLTERAEFRKGPVELGVTLDVAQTHFLAHLHRLEDQFSAIEPFLFGDSPCIADFSTYHCLWFVFENPGLRDIFKPFPTLLAWMTRMRAFGNGHASDLSSSAALDIARASQPDPISRPGAGNEEGDVCEEEVVPGNEVEVVPTDYGIDPVRGTLLVSSYEEIVIRRKSDTLGETHIHFPRMGFRISPR